MAKKVYAIKEGFDSVNNKKVENIIVNTWAECLQLVKGVKGAKYKSFESIQEANDFLYSAKDVLKKEDNNYPTDCLHIYVDGSYNSATGEYSYGLAAVKNNVVEYIDSGASKSSTANNIRQIAGELEAAVKGVEYAVSCGEKKVAIFHDYIGICYHATGFWERKEESSKEYYKKMQELMATGIEVVFVKVDSHTGDLFNELADEKCKEKLGIPSDRVVEKYLSSNVIMVKDEQVKSEIDSIAGAGKGNIIVGDGTAYGIIKEERTAESNSDVGDSLDQLISIFKEDESKAEKFVNKLKTKEKSEIIMALLNKNY